MSKHTPGPWHTKAAVSGPDRDVGIYADGCRCVLAECFEEFVERGVRRPEEARANARLIAAAPEMYEALRKADRMLDGNPAGVDDEADPNNPSPEDASAHTAGLIRQMLRAAIAKAEGR